MRPQTVLLLLVTAVTAVTSTYTDGNAFLDALPDCIKTCNNATISTIKSQCASASNNLQCVCETSDNLASDTAAAQCTLTKCSSSDQNDLIELGMEMATSCIPYISDNGTNSTSTSTSMSGSITMTSTSSGMTASPTSSMSTSTTTAGGTSAGADASSTPSSTASDSPLQTGAAAGRAVWLGSLVLAVPAAIMAGII